MLFPDYECESPVVSTAYHIKRYARRATERILQHEAAILRAARSIDGQATIVLERARRKLRNVKRVQLDDAWGQTSDTCIEISDAPMTESYVLGTLIHEALHDVFYHADGNAFSEEEEHRAMYALGEI